MLELKRCELDCRCVLETPKPTLFPFQYFDDGVKIYNQQASEQSGCRTLEKIFLMFWPYFVDEQIQLPSICEDVNFGATGSHLDTKTVHLCFMWPRSLQTSIAVCRPVLVNPRPAGNPREGLRTSSTGKSCAAAVVPPVAAVRLLCQCQSGPGRVQPSQSPCPARVLSRAAAGCGRRPGLGDAPARRRRPWRPSRPRTVTQS